MFLHRRKHNRHYKGLVLHTAQLRRGAPENLADEVSSQPRALEEFARSKLPKAPRESVFVGAGDSYAAALAAFYMSKADCLAVDPYSLVAFPGIAAGREVFFISVSGRTSSNIAAVMKVHRIAKTTTSLTSDGRSKLAASTDRTVKLPMKVVPRTPGLLSFSLSLLAALKISKGDVSCDFGRAFRRAEVDCRQMSFARGTTYFLGNAAAYAVSLYSAAKVYELLGTKAHAEMLEEFSHMELFSLRKSDSVNVFSCFDPSQTGARLRRALEEHGYKSRLIPNRGSSEVERLFHSVFVAQLAVLRRAEAIGLSKPRFLDAKDRLEVSDARIY